MPWAFAGRVVAPEIKLINPNSQDRAVARTKPNADAATGRNDNA